MQKLINNAWVDCTIDDLSTGDIYHIPVGNGGWQQQAYSKSTKSEIERKWRDDELASTDWIVPITDYPSHAGALIYRQELRDYPLEIDFPDGTRPAL